MAGLPLFKLANLNKSQLRGRKRQLEEFLNGHRGQAAVKAGPDRDRAQADLEAVNAELATEKRKAEWPEG